MQKIFQANKFTAHSGLWTLKTSDWPDTYISQSKVGGQMRQASKSIGLKEFTFLLALGSRRVTTIPCLRTLSYLIVII